MVNLELYKIFVTVADEQNLTRASEKLNLTQPAVTKHIKNLENILQVKLLIRSNHGIVLTNQGQALYKDIKDATNLLTNIETKYYKTRDINLGIHSTIVNKIFSKCLSEYYKKNPTSKINTINHENDQMLLELKNKELDIIFSKKISAGGENKNIQFIKLGKWNEVLIANENSKWKNKKVTLEDIKNATIYMPKRSSETPRNFFNSIDCKYEDFKDIKHMTYTTIIEVVKNTNGIGLVTKEFVSEEIIKNDLCILDTEFTIRPIEFGIYINKDNKFEDLKRFIQIVKNTFANN